MSGIFGNLNVNDSEFVFNATSGQEVVWTAAQDYLARVNAELATIQSAFVERTTDSFKFRYKLPGGGFLQKRNSDGSFANVKASGSWDVALPLEDWGAAQGGNDVDLAYMTVGELDNHIQTITIQNVNTVRYELLKSLLNSAEDSFVDERRGTLLIEPLANGDTVLYPPVLGSAADATENHYVGSNYVTASMSDTNNPYNVAAADLEEHFGAATGGSQIASFINPAEASKTRALTDFVDVTDIGVQPGANTDRVNAVPAELLSVGRVLGRLTLSGVWVVEWRWMPATYILTMHLEAPKPVLRRIDPAATGLGDGLQLVAQPQFADTFPFRESFWRHRFGYGVGNRLNGHATQLVASTSYTTPTAYA